MQITLEEFETRLDKHYQSDRYFYYLTMCSFIGFGVLCILKGYRLSSSLTTEKHLMYVLMGLFMSGLGTWGLFILRRKYKLYYFENTLTKFQNIELIKLVKLGLTNEEQQETTNFMEFQIAGGWWKKTNKVFFFADEYYVAFNVESVKGLFDFGADHKRNEMIRALFNQHLAEIKN